MANYCSSVFKFFAADPDNERSVQALQSFFNTINTELCNNSTSQDYCYLPFSKIAGAFGYPFPSESTPLTSGCCRGGITSISYCVNDSSIDNITIETETCWDPKAEFWDKIIEDNFSSDDGSLIEYVYCAVEQGCGIFINSDEYGRFFDCRYYIDIYLPYENERVQEIMPECNYSDESSFINDFNELFGTDFTTFFECEQYGHSEEFYYRYGEEAYCSVYEYSFS